ncbi:MAG TPA: hypothetical protein VFN39_03655 [Gemmatimonadaceae bacterium]|nr:hypothetical protein [Gemmatimonadaceae bacterium]
MRPASPNSWNYDFADFPDTASTSWIDLGVPVTVSRWDSDHVVGTIGDGQGTIRIDAGSGGVRLKKRP